jgi:uncharacterized protein
MFGLCLMQGILFLAHWFIFHTIVVFLTTLTPTTTLILRCVFFSLAFSFVVAAMLSFRFSHLLVVGLYRIAAVWLGFLNFFFLAACLCWLADLVMLVSQPTSSRLHDRPTIAAVLFTCAVLACIYGLINAFSIRIQRIPVSLPNLPAAWRGRTALVISDLHLGNINGVGFSRRVARMAAGLHPDIVFIPGDFYDGTRLDPVKAAAPFRELKPPLGVYFSSGNHDEYGDLPHFLEALRTIGIRILSNEKVEIDGLTVVGVPYGASTNLLHMRATLEGMHLDSTRPSILLNHVPNRLPIAEQAGVSLQISGHTHGGQVVPFTWLTRRAFGKFTHGLQRFGAMQVYTSYGVGTWGPPIRVGTTPEIVLLEFQ